MSERTKAILEALKNAEHVIWDWNGTLLDDLEHAVACGNHLLRDHGLPLVDLANYRSRFRFPIKAYYDDLGFDYSKESFASLCDRFVDRFMAGVRDLPLMKDTTAVVEELHARGIQQSILSATDQINLDETIRHFKLDRYFMHVYGIGDKMAGSKIARGEELIRTAKAPLEKTVMVGDTLHDLEVAQALGIEALLIAHGHQDVERLRGAHSRVIYID